MGHGKETPRQKMIGMMYLVLTAMLALNVSAEVLDAFGAVDEGLNKTAKIYGEKNLTLYNEFNEQYVQNEIKVKPWKDKADEVQKRSNELFDYIQDLKIKIITVGGQGDPEDGVITEDGEINNAAIEGKDKMDAPSQVLIGPNMDGKAFELKDKINVYRDYLVSLVDEEDVRVISSLQTNLDTEDPKHGESEHNTWEVKNFAHMPLAAVMPLLTKMQLDVRNSESEIVQYLYNEIDAGSFSFNKLEATVIPNSSYILQGNPYKADVFLAAVDTTLPPIVYIGQYDSTYNEENDVYEYNMVGKYDSLDVVEGKGKFERLSNSLGKQSWGGILKLMGPDGNYITKPFKRTYQIAKPNLVVSATKMNVFYVGVDNPVSVSIAGVPGDKITPTITNGRIVKQRDGVYIVIARRPGNSLISVRAEIDGVLKNMGVSQFRVKALPDPVIKVAGKKGGRIAKNVLAAQAGVFAEMENFDFELEFKITEFTVSTTDKGGYQIDQKSKGNTFTKAQYDLIKNLRSRSKVIIEKVKAVGPDGKVRNLAPIVFEII